MSFLRFHLFTMFDIDVLDSQLTLHWKFWAEGLHRVVYFAELKIDLLKQVWPLRVAAR